MVPTPLTPFYAQLFYHFSLKKAYTVHRGANTWSCKELTPSHYFCLCFLTEDSCLILQCMKGRFRQNPGISSTITHLNDNTYAGILRGALRGIGYKQMMITMIWASGSVLRCPVNHLALVAVSPRKHYCYQHINKMLPCQTILSPLSDLVFFPDISARNNWSLFFFCSDCLRTSPTCPILHALFQEKIGHTPLDSTVQMGSNTLTSL